jgi:hypothetical protein
MDYPTKPFISMSWFVVCVVISILLAMASDTHLTIAPLLTSWGVIAGLATLLGLRTFSPALRSLKDQHYESNLLNQADLILCGFVMLIAIWPPFFGLGELLIPGAYGWELPHNAFMASVFHTVVQDGIISPGISQGFLWYLMHYVSQFVLGISPSSFKLVLAINFSVTAGLIYIATRHVAGRWSALIACFLFIGSPLELGLARNHYGFQLSYPIILLLFITCVRRERHNSLFNNTAIVILMGMCNLTYCSSILFILFPFLYFALRFNRTSARKEILTTSLTLICGVSFWLCLPTIISSLHTGNWKFVSPATVHTSDRAIYFERDPENKSITNDTHQALAQIASNFINELTLLVNLQDDSYLFATREGKSRFISTLCLVGILVTISVRRTLPAQLSAALISWLICGSIPGVLSHEFATRRFLVLTPILYIGAAVAFGTIFNNVYSFLKFPTNYFCQIRSIAAACVLIVSIKDLPANLSFLMRQPSDRHQEFAEYVGVACYNSDICVIRPGDALNASVSIQYLVSSAPKMRTGETLLVNWSEHSLKGSPLVDVVSKQNNIYSQWIYNKTLLNKAIRKNSQSKERKITVVIFPELSSLSVEKSILDLGFTRWKGTINDHTIENTPVVYSGLYHVS